jgi:hypothetical protein
VHRSVTNLEYDSGACIIDPARAQLNEFAELAAGISIHAVDCSRWPKPTQ